MLMFVQMHTGIFIEVILPVDKTIIKFLFLLFSFYYSIRILLIMVMLALGMLAVLGILVMGLVLLSSLSGFVARREKLGECLLSFKEFRLEICYVCDVVSDFTKD